MKLNLIFLTILFSFLSLSLQAQQGFLDTTFNAKGPVKGKIASTYLTVTGSNASAGARAVVVDQLGRIVTMSCAPSQYDIFVTRFTPDGIVDSTFGIFGTTSINYLFSQEGKCMALQQDGRILIGGYRVNGLNSDMLVIRLNSDGTLDNTFGINGAAVFDLGSDEKAFKISLQSDEKIILAGTFTDVQGAPKMTVIRVNQSGSIDTTTFATFVSSSPFNESMSGLDVANDTIAVVGNYYNNVYYYSVIKLYPNGKTAWSNGSLDFSPAAGVYPSDLAFENDGNIIVLGNEFDQAGYPTSRITRISTVGQIDTSIILYPLTQGTAYTYTDLLLDDDDGKIMVSGYINNTYLAIKIDKKGIYDNTFGINGMLFINGSGYSAFSYHSAFSKDHKLLLAGLESGSSGVSSNLLKVNLKSVMHIVGNSFVLPKTRESYKVEVPSLWAGYNYSWYYNGTYVDYLSTPTSSSFALYFLDSATSGQLICYAYNGSTFITSVSLDIIVNDNPTQAFQLSDLKCTNELSDCALGYIDNFSLNSINNTNSGCSENGYSDYTNSAFGDTLSGGGVYSAKLKIPNNGGFTNYVGIWIDYNNDGKFSNIDEFVGEGYSTDSDVDVNNIILKNREGNDGPKRMRIRSRPDLKFSSVESCQTHGEMGETEDYLIVISTQPTLEAPQIITPNDDGLNDYFVIRGINPTISNKLTIFDRVGSLKFTTSDYQNSWNGIDSKGEKLSPGTYYYVFTSGKEAIKGFMEIRY